MRVNCHDCPVEKKTMYTPSQQLQAWEKNVKPNLCGQPSPHYTTTCRWRGLGDGWDGGVVVGWMDGRVDKFKGIAYEEQLARRRRHFTQNTL